MRIIKLSSENLKRLVAVEISPTGDVVVIGGDNAQGKSSVLDSISMALASIVTENGYQLWIERVSKGSECSVVIENGRIAKNQ